MLVYNKSQSPREPERDDITTIGIYADKEADDIGSNQVAGVIALGTLIEKSGIIPIETLKAAFKDVIPERHHDLIPMNKEAIDKGVEHAKDA